MREWLWINPAWDECRLNCQKRDFWVATICFQTYVGEEIKTCISNIGISFNFGKVWKEIFHLSDIKNALLLFFFTRELQLFHLEILSFEEGKSCPCLEIVWGSLITPQSAISRRHLSESDQSCRPRQKIHLHKTNFFSDWGEKHFSCIFAPEVKRFNFLRV